MKNLLFTLFISLLMIYSLLSLFQNDQLKNEINFTPVIGKCNDCVNIHGMKSNSTGNPPPLSGWKLLEKNDSIDIVHYSETTGKRKIDPVGFYLTENNLALYYNSSPAGNYDDWAGHPHATTQDGSLISFSEDLMYHKNYEGNPVLNEPQYNWQGKNRTNPYALVWHEDHQTFYTFYGDFAEKGDNDKYPGRRALGVAKSKNLIDWEYLSVDEPLFHIRDMENFAPEVFKSVDDVTRQGRVYAFGAIYHDGFIYLNVGGSTNRELNFNFIIRSQDPLEGWELVMTDAPRPMPMEYDGKWYSLYNMRADGNPDGRAIGLEVADCMTCEYERKGQLFDIQHWTSAGHSRQLFMYKGRWYIAFRVGDEDNNRSLRIAVAE